MSDVMPATVAEALKLPRYNLGQFCDAFEENGFDALEEAKELEDDDLKEMGLKKGHIKKFRRMIKELEAIVVAPGAAATKTGGGALEADGAGGGEEGQIFGDTATMGETGEGVAATEEEEKGMMEETDDDDPPTDLIFVGNPGVGKSTIINGMLDMGEAKFHSGLSSTGGGVTAAMQSQRFGPYRYTDTPGLSDVDLRKKAAAAITKALQAGKKTVKAKIFFVVTEESLRIRPEDKTTIQIVLGACTEIKHYGIIVNKITKKKLKKLNTGNNMLQWKAKLLAGLNTKTNDFYFNLKDEDLEDEDDAVKGCSVHLKNFVFNDGPTVNIYQASQVTEIKSDKFEAMQEAFGKTLNLLEKNNEALKEEQAKLQADIVQMNEERKQQEALREKERRDNQTKMEKMMRDNKKEIEEMEKQRKDDAEAAETRMNTRLEAQREAEEKRLKEFQEKQASYERTMNVTVELMRAQNEKLEKTIQDMEEKAEDSLYKVYELEDGSQLYVGGDSNWVYAAPKDHGICGTWNSDPARRKWKLDADGILSLKDGRQLYVNPQAWASAEHPGTYTNTDPARRTWTLKAGVLTLRDGRQLYYNPRRRFSAEKSCSCTNWFPSRREFTVK